MLKTEKHGTVMVATLDRPAALNSLNLELATRLLTELRRCEADDSVSAIVLRGSGPKAFCAGGDVKTVCAELAKGNERYALDFFTTEYRLDHAIHASQKPILALGHGYVMGGGIGLTGFRLNAADALWGQLADAFVPDEALDELVALVVASGEARTKEHLKALVEGFSARFAAKLPPARLEPRLSRINDALSGTDPRAAFARLAKLAGEPGTPCADEPLAEAARNFAAGSPTSAFVTWEQLKRGLCLSLEACFRMELALAVQFGRRHDFREGVRAVLVDKDKRPSWRPATLDAVKSEDVAAHFASPWGAAPHPLADL
ncbi:MAG: enoyl-CoA hydratase/isomerase family protein [Deltaproteobacteria bacterium]|nr:enoyl-CoA hydratase/isomerase family protein [Deltaproteobacteria bacterium]